MPINGNELDIDDIFKIFGVNEPKSNARSSLIRPLPTDKSTQYSSMELATLVNRTFQARSTRNTQITDTPNGVGKGLSKYLMPTSKHIENVIKDSQRFKELCPEITEASEITVSSIMAPSDLQETDPSITVDNMDTVLSEDVSRNIVTYLEKYFMTDFSMGKKLRSWIEDALFISGAKCIVVLPERVTNSLYQSGKPNDGSNNPDNIKATMSANRKPGVAVEALSDFNKAQQRKRSGANTKRPISQYEIWDKYKDDKCFSNEYCGGIESFNHQFATEFTRELKMGSRLLTDKVMTQLQGHENFESYKNMIAQGIEDITVKFASKLKEGDILHISENPEILRAGKFNKDTAQRNMAGRFYKEVINPNTGMQDEATTTTSNMEYVSFLDHMYSDTGPSISHPIIMEFPTGSIIPVCVPGSKREHIGYFALIDRYGYPVEPSTCLFEDTSSCSNGGAATAFATAFGSGNGQMMYNTFSKSLTYGNGNASDSFDPRTSALSSVFDYVLDATLKNRLSNMGLGSVELGQFNTISMCMLKRFFEQKETCLVYIPKEFVTYLAYDYRADGTGKSKLEDIKILLSIRANLIVAGMMSAANAAIPHKRLDVTFDENDTEWENTFQTVMEMAVLKSNGGLYLSYADIMADIADRHLTVAPKGIHGIDGLQIEKSESTNSSVRVDESLMDLLTRLITLALGVPSAALNQVSSEQEYAVSVLTRNIFWGNKISILQGITCKHMSRFIQTCVKYDPILIRDLVEILNGTPLTTLKDRHIITPKERKDEKIHLAMKVADNDGSVDISKADTTDVMAKLEQVIGNLRIVLPSPNIAADKAKYEEAKLCNDLMGTLFDQIFNRDIIAKDGDLNDTFAVLAAMMKADASKRILENVGLTNLLDSPDIGKFIQQRGTEYRKLFRQLRNYGASIDDEKLLQTREPSVPAAEGEEGGDTSSSSPW